MAKTKKYRADKSADLLALELLGYKFVKLLKDGTCLGKKSKKGATHSLTGTKLSSLIEPLKKWPKSPKEMVPAGRETLGAQPDAAHEVKPEGAGSWHAPIPEGATHAAYRTSKAFMMVPVLYVEDFRDFRSGELLFGKLRYGEDFVVISPEAQAGNIIRWKDGITCFAEGKDPASLKNAAKALAERAAAPAGQSEHIKAAFAAQVAKRRAAPGPRAGDVAGKIQNGVRKPGAGGKTARVWEICDELLAKLKRCPTKAEVAAISVEKEKASPGMTNTNYSYWKRFYGHSAA